MNKITLAGFAADNAPKWVATKSKNAWGHASIIAERKALGATLQELADDYGVSMPTISRIIKTHDIGKALRRDLKNTRTALDQAEKELAWTKKDLTEAEERADSYKADLKAACFRASEADKFATETIEALHADLAAAKANEQAAVDRLNNGDSWANRWQNEYLQAKADLEAAEAQIDQMAERLAECRNRGFWARVFNR